VSSGSLGQELSGHSTGYAGERAAACGVLPDGRNRLQIVGRVKDVMAGKPLAAKYKASMATTSESLWMAMMSKRITEVDSLRNLVTTPR
jgi:hypothetical protein